MIPLAIGLHVLAHLAYVSCAARIEPMVAQAWVAWGLPVAAIAFAAVGFLFVGYGTRRFDRKYGAGPK